MSEITPDELSERLQSDGDSPYVLDIREKDEFHDWHIPGSENVPVYEELSADLEAARAALAEVPDDRTVVTVCAAGVRSKTATKLLREMGYDAKTLVDGMNGWSQVHRNAPLPVDLEGTVVQVTRPGKGCLSYILISNGEAAVYDPSQYVEEYEAIIEQHDAELVGVFDTHAHADHVSGGRKLAERNGVPYFLHPNDGENVAAEPIGDGETISVGSVEVDVVHTPGHSPGGVTYALGENALLTGDTLFHESVGRVELGVEAGIETADVRANADRLYRSLRRIRAREGDPLILPAHDPGSPEPPVAAKLSDVLRRNSDLTLDHDEFVEELASDIPDHPPNFERVKQINTGAESAESSDLTSLELGPNRCAIE